MSNSRIFIRTTLGNEILGVSYGKISGDARRLLALIDGRLSVGDIHEKVPLSVQVQLEAILNELISERLISLKVRGDGDIPSDSSWYYPKEEIQQILPAEPQPGISIADEDWKEERRRIELEHELAEVRSQLEASKARQKEVEEICLKLEQQVAGAEQGKQDKPAGNMQQLSGQAGGGAELHDSLDNFSQLNQALLDQQFILDSTLKLRTFRLQLNEDQIQQQIDTGEQDEASSHPHYHKLRGLEFFKGFPNAEMIDFLNYAKWKKVWAGETILKEGEVGMPFFIIVSGSVKVIRKIHVLASLGWGEFFGEFAHLSGDVPVRSAKVVATTDCELLVVDPLEVEFSSVQMRLHVVEALLRGQVRRALLSSQRIDSLLSQLNIHGKHDQR